MKASRLTTTSFCAFPLTPDEAGNKQTDSSVVKMNSEPRITRQICCELDMKTMNIFL